MNDGFCPSNGCLLYAGTDKSDSPPWILENSGIITKQYFITSKSRSIGCYGSEFDVWIAKDNKLVVNHDPVYKMRPMEYSKGDALTGLKLSNGENLPSLEQYLEAGKKL
mgnify:CR=1 FL=1